MIEKVAIDTDHIRLDQFLKYIAIAQTGGHAKFLIQEGAIKVNDEICLQRGKKLIKNDKIDIEGQGTFVIVDK